MLKENLEKVEENIQAACDRAGRKRDEVTLIAVSKTKPVEMLQEAYDLGVRINGENKLRRTRSDINADAEDLLAVHCLSPRGLYGSQAPVARLHQQHERVNRVAQPV